MNAGRDASAFQMGAQCIAAVNKDNVKMRNVVLSWPAGRDDARVAQAFGVALRDGAAFFIPSVEQGQLCTKYRRLDLVEPAVASAWQFHRKSLAPAVLT